MSTLSKLFFHRMVSSTLLGLVVLGGFLLSFKITNPHSTPRQNPKNILAQIVVSCLRTKAQNPALDCQAFLQNAQSETRELGYQVWVTDSSGALTWSNTPAPPPVSLNAFGGSPLVYTFTRPRRFSAIEFPAPDGYVDDPVSKARVYIGAPIGTNTGFMAQYRGLVFVALLFVVGIIFSSLLTFFVLARRAREAKRVLARLREGDLGVRFKTTQLDELSALSGSFNQMIDLLASSLKEVKSSEENRRALISELSHDLRTPLTSMTSFVQLLQGSQVSETLRKECVQSISAEIGYLNRLVSSLFELSQIESPRARSERVQIDLRKIVEEVCSDFALASMQNSIRVASELGDARPLPVLGDAILAKRMLCNLIENALRFARSEVRVSLRTEPSTSQALIEIKDDGKGFSPQALATYGSSPGKRSLDPTSPGTVHLGLGSVIATKIAVFHNGQLSAENLEPSGAKITVSIPLTSRS